MFYNIAQKDLICSNCDCEIPVGASYFFKDEDSTEQYCEKCERELLNENWLEEPYEE